MRLRLIVQRHGLPPVHVLWTVGTIRPPYAAAGTSPTISQLLEQVNDIIPLESEDWGLEDYAVEVQGFECLHFSELSQVLKEEDEVFIRALQTSDLRARKLSGRHQISSDGKHLIDGVAFGRPFLRRADRPPIRIPPRKRRRITYDEENDPGLGEEANDQQIVIRAGFDNSDEAMTGDEESEYDEDFALDDEGNDDLGAELVKLRSDLHSDAAEEDSATFEIIVGTEDSRDGQERPGRFTRSRKSPKGLGLLRLVDDDGQPFVGKYSNPLLDMYSPDEPSRTGQTLKSKDRRKGKHPQNSGERAFYVAQDSSASPERVIVRSSAGSSKSVRFEDEASATPATVHESADSDEADDEDFLPGEVDESDKENAEPGADLDNFENEFSDGPDSSSSIFSELKSSESEETSSSGPSSSDESSSDSEPEQIPSSTSKHQPNASETSSSASSSSSSSSESEAQTAIQKKKTWALNNVTHKTPVEISQITITAPKEPLNTAPGEGKKNTKARNQRRKACRRLTYLKRKGILPADATVADYHKFNEKEQEQLNVAQVDGPEAGENAETNKVESDEQSKTSNGASTLEVERHALLDSIAAGGAEVSPHSTRQEGAAAAAASSSMEGGDVTMGKDSSQNKTTDASDTMQASSLDPLPTPSSQHRRSKLDLAGTKRMLFGSLGLKTPKTKEEDIEMREKLMKDVRPMKQTRPEREVETSDDLAAIAADDSWKDKIDLKAVECCYDGVELSTPPFPFVQRWDPQQQRGHNFEIGENIKGGKKRKRKNDKYYGNRQDIQNRNKRVRQQEYETCSHQTDLEETTLDTNAIVQEQNDAHDPSFEDSLAVNEQLLRESGGYSANPLVESEETIDLPALPKDVSICPALTRDISTPRSIIAFKKLDMSADTNWQPNISPYRIAVINRMAEDGTLQMTLAKRDTPAKKARYDEETGDRLYGKFEMPGYNDEDEETDNGNIEISFDELINPIVIQAAEEKPHQEQQRQHQQPQIMGSDQLESSSAVEPKATHNTNSGQQLAGLDGTMDNITEAKATGPSEETRHEISEILKDAGWRSSVNSAVNKDLIAQPDRFSSKDNHEQENVTPSYSPSPTFNGPSSSPPFKGFDVASSPVPAEVQDAQSRHASGAEIAESVPPQDPNDSDATSVAKSAVEYPDLPAVIDDSELSPEEPPHQRDTPEIGHQDASKDLTSPNDMHKSPSQSTRSHTRASPEHTSQKAIKSFDGPSESEDEFPELFSQAFEARLSQEMDIKPEPSSDVQISPPAYPKSKPNGRLSSSQNESKRDWKLNWSDDEEDDGGSTPRPSQSQPLPSSQIVDLTLSSDTVDPPESAYGDGDDDDDSYRLPNGPGWVKNTRTSKGRAVSAKGQSGRRKTRSR